MKISVRASGGFHLTIRLPLSLLCGPLGARIACRFVSVDGNEHEITPQQIRPLLSSLKDGKKILNGLPLVEAESGDGDSVRIVL